MSGRTLAKSARYSTRSTVSSKVTANEPSRVSRKAMAKEEEKECSSSTHSREDAPWKRPHLKRKRKNQSSVTAVESESEAPAYSQLAQNQGSRKLVPAKAKGTGNASTATTTDDASTPPKKKRKSPGSPVQITKAEKRLRVFRKRAPQSYFDKLARATSQR